jgi:hypothetical protein
VRPRDPRRRLERRRRARARVTLVDEPRSSYAEDGSIGSKQSAEVTLPRPDLERMWSAEYLERLARTYWSFLTRFSLGILRVLYTDDAREVVVFRRPLLLLRFHKPEYHLEPDGGSVTWPIEKGLLVAPAGRGGRGYLRLSVSRTDPEDDSAGEVTVTISSEVVNFYPLIAGWGWFAKVGRLMYNQTQLRIHVIVTHAFLRSLANLDLEESRVGALSRASRPLSPAASPGRDEP